MLTGHIYVDGSVLHGSDPVLARAGYGVVMSSAVGTWDARLFGAYAGPIQCIDAAEVYAALVAVRFAAGSIVVYSDSSFFVGGWHRGRSWCTAASRTHADVWRKFWDVAEDFGIENIHVVKVKGHATQADLDNDLSTPMDKWGNDLADQQAKRGAALHPVCQATAAERQAEVDCAEQVVSWVGAGLEAAEASGALPPKLSAQEKVARPRQVKAPSLQVAPDEEWARQQFVVRQINKLHESHALWHVPPFVFCIRCGAYSTHKVQALGEPCTRKVASSKAAFLRRLRDGCHPRTGEYFGEVCVLDIAALKSASTGPRLTAG